MSKTLEELRDSDVFDSRDVIERIEELETEIGDDDAPDDYVLEREELAALRDFVAEADSTPDWRYGETFIRDSYFEDYARELAEDIGAIDPEAGWPLAHIDWEAAAHALQVDYLTVELDDVTFWVRA